MSSLYESTATIDEGLTPRLVSSLYVEAMVLADEVRTYFDEIGRLERDLLSPLLRVTFSCESLKVTARLMHIIAWLLSRRAVQAGEITPEEGVQASRRLGEAADSEDDVIDVLPERARMLINYSRDLYARVARLDRELVRSDEGSSPALRLIDRIQASF